jgi:fructokinase
MTSPQQRIAAVECGGTSFKVAVCSLKARSAGSSNNNSAVVEECVDILHQSRVPTGNGPAATLEQVVAILQAHGPYVAAGIASFGPVSVKPSDGATRYGTILDSSPKIEWRGVDILGAVRRAVGPDCPIVMDTDVNAPAAAEYHALTKTSDSISSCAYVTIGTGVGVGLVVNGKTVHGHMHPEGGHVPVAALNVDNGNQSAFAGYSWGSRVGSKCPFAGVRTVEGMVSSVALTEHYCLMEKQKRQQQGLADTMDKEETLDRDILQTVSDDHEIWNHAAYTIASLCTTLLLTLSMEHIVLGGGVMQRTCLLPKIREYTRLQLNGYLDLGSGGEDSQVQADLQRIITTSRHGDDAGLYGAIFLAMSALPDGQSRRNDTLSTLSVQEKQQAFRIGLWQGLLVGVVGTALILQNGWFRIGRRQK